MDGESAVVQVGHLEVLKTKLPAAISQVTTPAAEFQCDMEFWDIPEHRLQRLEDRA